MLALPVDPRLAAGGDQTSRGSMRKIASGVHDLRRDIACCRADSRLLFRERVSDHASFQSVALGVPSWCRWDPSMQAVLACGKGSGVVGYG